VGNTGGLGALFGILTAVSSACPWSASRSRKHPGIQPTNQPLTNHRPLTKIKLQIGVKVPKPGSLGFKIATAVQAITGWFAKLFGGKE
jgi:hypothetical protein